MKEELITIWVKQVLGPFLLNRRLLARDSYECRMTDSVRKELKEMNVDSVIIPGEYTKYIQASDVCWNKPFKARMTKLYDQWLNEGVHQSTEGGNMRPPSRKRITEGVLDAWSQLSKENVISLLKCCDLTLANDGMEDDFIHCLKKGHPYKAGKQKLSSQLSILVDESNAINPFISPSDEEDANEEMNVIEDETEIIMKICSFFNLLSCVKEKSCMNNTSDL